jgi:hypothetical protein
VRGENFRAAQDNVGTPVGNLDQLAPIDLSGRVHGSPRIGGLVICRCNVRREGLQRNRMQDAEQTGPHAPSRMHIENGLDNGG